MNLFCIILFAGLAVLMYGCAWYCVCRDWAIVRAPAEWLPPSPSDAERVQVLSRRLDSVRAFPVVGVVWVTFLLGAASAVGVAIAWEAQRRGKPLDISLLAQPGSAPFLILAGMHMAAWLPVFSRAYRTIWRIAEIEVALGLRRRAVLAAPLHAARHADWTILSFAVLLGTVQVAHMKEPWSSIVVVAFFLRCILPSAWPYFAFQRAAKHGFQACPECGSLLKDPPPSASVSAATFLCTKCGLEGERTRLNEYWGVTSAGIPLAVTRDRRTQGYLLFAVVCALSVISLVMIAREFALLWFIPAILLIWGASVLRKRKLARLREKAFLSCPVCEYALPSPPDIPTSAFKCSECGFAAPYSDLEKLWSSAPEEREPALAAFKAWFSFGPPAGSAPQTSSRQEGSDRA